MTKAHRAAPKQKRKQKRAQTTPPANDNRTASRLSGALLLIGVGVIAALDIGWWPWVLVLFMLSIVPQAFARGGLAGGLFGLYWGIGLFVISATDTFWPGILFVAGLSLIVRRLVQPRRR
ncbi:MAG: hypothetical protein K8S97_13430 [Anaerolineae bacterium]|nr:hypothetical protein [Anaerolineae bacterium]